MRAPSVGPLERAGLATVAAAGSTPIATTRTAAVDVGDLRAAVPGKPFLAALAAAFDALEQPPSGAAGDLRGRRRTRRLSSARSGDGDVASGSSADTDACRGEFVLRVSAQCLFYLQGLFQAMLTPTMSDSGLVTQWRINAQFVEGLGDADGSALGPASPSKILTLGGHMLEQTALIVNSAADEASLAAPGSFDVAFFPCLQYLRLDHCVVDEIKNWRVLRTRLKARAAC